MSRCRVFTYITLLVLLQQPACPAVEEFRAAWVATVWNIDWPSKPALSTARQQQELRAIFDEAKDIGLNTIIFQVRPAGDTFYKSAYEPWSGFLTGAMGRAPKPFYDPLEFAIKEAHKRGLKLHAWINPFRAKSGSYSFTSNHIIRKRPEWVKRSGKKLWMEPGIPEARTYVLKVTRDLVKRYDIDGIHIDDYFYPYPPSNLKPKRQIFDDSKSWNTYRKSGGKLSRNDWRRDNINQFVENFYKTVKRAKPHVLVGISPFGIWRPGVPPSIKASLDAYEHLCADSRFWLQMGWCDYFSPQLYWSIHPPDQSFTTLLHWWNDQNVKGVKLWPGIASDRVGPKRSPDEIIRQIKLTRAVLKHPGHIHWSFSPLKENRRGLSKKLKTSVYYR
ncbi:MAG: family 10 glycosylhydrolase [Verrucomicrobiota bacterium]